MKIDIDSIGPEGLDINETVPGDWIAEILGTSHEFRAANDGRVEVHLTRMQDDVHVRGRAILQLKGTCSRCLSDAAIAVDTALECMVVPRSSEPKSADDGELSESSMDVATYDDHEIDLHAVMRDEVLLQLPMRALCGDNCAGLCTHCGKNLNDETCDCVSVDIAEGPFGALKRIKLKDT